MGRHHPGSPAKVQKRVRLLLALRSSPCQPSTDGISEPSAERHCCEQDGALRPKPVPTPTTNGGADETRIQQKNSSIVENTVQYSAPFQAVDDIATTAVALLTGPIANKPRSLGSQAIRRPKPTPAASHGRSYRPRPAVMALLLAVSYIEDQQRSSDLLRRWTGGRDMHPGHHLQLL